MKNHFYISYAGNKREEVKTIYDNLNLNNIETIIEPYGGSCAMSYYIWLHHPNLKFVLNDNNKFLMKMFNIIRNDNLLNDFEQHINNKLIPKIKQSKNDYLEVIKNKDNDVYSWFIANKFYTIRAGLYNTNINSYKNIDIKNNNPIYNFFKNGNIEFYNIDGIEIYDKYKNNKTNLILLDPPYLLSENCF